MTTEGRHRNRLSVGRSPQFGLFAQQPPLSPQQCGVHHDGIGDTPEQRYAAHLDLAHRRRHAQFFTPLAMARFMAAIAAPRPGEAVLDPACGPGVFTQAIDEACPGLRPTSVDIDPHVLAYLAADTSRAAKTESVHADFLAWDDARSFDLVIGNPPYLKYQHFDCPDALYETLGARYGIAISRLSNLYLLFLLESYRRLRPGGRLVFIVPAEWTNANFGTAFKQFLQLEGCLEALIYFSHLSEQFDDALTTASVVVLRKPVEALDRRCSFTALYVSDGAELDAVRAALSGPSTAPGVVRHVFDIEPMAGEKKWDHLLRHGPAALHVEGAQRPLGSWCASRRGIATGANAFFHLRRSRAIELQLAEQHLVGCVGGSRQVQGLVFDASDHRALVERDEPTVLVDFGDAPSKAELRYIASGERDGLPHRHLLSKRRPWYTMECIVPAPIWIGVFGRRGLRAVRNRAGVAHLTTFHGLYPGGTQGGHDPLLCDALVVLLNSAQAQAEALRRRRVYGAGLEKLEPADLLDLVVPDLTAAAPAQLADLAQWLAPMDHAVRDAGQVDAALAARVEAAVGRLIASLGEQNPLRRGAVDVEPAAAGHDVCIEAT